MAEIEPIKRKQGVQYPTLVSEDGRVDQKMFRDKGIRAVDFGEHNTTNTIPLHLLAGGGTSSQMRRFRGNLDTMAENVEASFAHAKQQGKFNEWGNWYRDANNVAAQMAVKHGVPHHVASGVVAALSLGKTEWSKNVENVDTFFTLAKRGLPTPTSSFSNATVDQLSSAHRMLRGEDPFEVLGPEKGGNFYRNVADPEKHADDVTVDTQMGFLTQGWKRPWAGSGAGAPDPHNPTKYRHIAGMVREVSHAHGVTGSEGQAIGWTAVKDIAGGVPGTPPTSHPRFAEYYNVRDRNLPAAVRKRFR